MADPFADIPVTKAPTKAPDPFADIPSAGYNPNVDKPLNLGKLPPRPEPEETKPGLIDRLGKVLESGGFGAAVSYFSPEIVSYGIAPALAAFPFTAPAAPFVEAAGQTMRGARLAEAATGAMSGVGGETLKQTADVAGASNPVQVGAEIVGSMTGPGVTKFLAGQAGRILGLGASEAKQAINRLSSDAVESGVINEAQREHLKRVASGIKGKATEDDIMALYRVIQEGAAGVKQEGQKAMTEAEKKAAGMTAQGQKYGQIATERTAAAQQKVSNIGQQRELSDIGNDLRNDIAPKQQAALAQRAADYKALEETRDTVLAQKEAAGEYIENSPGYKELMADLEKALRKSTEGKTQRAAQITDPGVTKAFEDLYTALKPKQEILNAEQVKQLQAKGITDIKTKKEGVLDPDTGTVVDRVVSYRDVPPDFKAIDTVRRRLGDAAFGKEAEGYAALKGNLAQDFYKRLAKLQEDFVGAPQKALQDSYKEHSGWLDKYKAQLGKKVTALDRFDETKFATDPKSLPDTFFQSQQSVKDLMELTGGNKALVSKAASEYAARNVGKTVKEVEAFEKNNSEMLRELPDVKAKVAAYKKELWAAERTGQAVEGAVNKLGVMAKETTAAGQKALSEAEQRANMILGDKFPADRIKGLLTSGSKKEWQEIGPMIAKSPEGKKAFAQALQMALGQDVSGLVLTKPGSIGALFEDKIAPAIRDAKLMDDKQLGILRSQLEKVYQSPRTPEAKLGMRDQLILRAIQGGGATLGTSATDTLFGLHKTGE